MAAGRQTPLIVRVEYPCRHVAVERDGYRLKAPANVVAVFDLVPGAGFVGVAFAATATSALQRASDRTNPFAAQRNDRLT